MRSSNETGPHGTGKDTLDAALLANKNEALAVAIPLLIWPERREQT